MQHREQQVRVTAREDRHVLGGQPCGLGAAGVDHHDATAALADRRDPAARVGHRGDRAVGDRRVGAEHEQVVGAVDVGHRQQRVVAEHLQRREVLRELVDRGGREDVAAAQHLLQALGRQDRGGVGGRVAEVDPHRVAAVASPQLAHPGADLGVRRGPGGRHQLAVHPVQRRAQPGGVLVQVLQGGGLGTEVAAAEHVGGVAVDAQHPLAAPVEVRVGPAAGRSAEVHADPAVRLAQRALTLHHPHRPGRDAGGRSCGGLGGGAGEGGHDRTLDPRVHDHNEDRCTGTAARTCSPCA